VTHSVYVFMMTVPEADLEKKSLMKRYWALGLSQAVNQAESKGFNVIKSVEPSYHVGRDVAYDEDGNVVRGMAALYVELMVRAKA